jgi:hypothetical protein
VATDALRATFRSTIGPSSTPDISGPSTRASLRDSPGVPHRRPDQLFAFGIDPLDSGLPEDRPWTGPPSRRSAAGACLRDAVDGALEDDALRPIRRPRGRLGVRLAIGIA